MLSPPGSWDSGLSSLGFRSSQVRHPGSAVLQELKGALWRCMQVAGARPSQRTLFRDSGKKQRLEPAAAAKFLLAWHWKEGQAKWEAVPPPLAWPARAICRTPVGRWLTRDLEFVSSQSQYHQAECRRVGLELRDSSQLCWGAHGTPT